MRMLDVSDCSFVAWGDSVWKSIRRLRPTRIEGDVHCELHKVRLILYSLPLSPLPLPSSWRKYV